VGSLLRPAALLRARDDFAAGRIDARQLRAAEDQAITGAVAMQRNAGLRAVTDGEFRRALRHMDFINQIGGIGKAPGTMAVRFHGPAGDIEWTPAALHYRGGPASIDPAVYPDMEEFWHDLSAAYAQQVAASKATPSPTTSRPPNSTSSSKSPPTSGARGRRRAART
jgi:5-methyltetrahydropteroyltriglutamate--homocysteine methyltransferase